MSRIHLRNGGIDLLALVTACVGNDRTAVATMLQSMTVQERTDCLVVAIGELSAQIEAGPNPAGTLEAWRDLIERERR